MSPTLRDAELKQIINPKLDKRKRKFRSTSITRAIWNHLLMKQGWIYVLATHSKGSIPQLFSYLWRKEENQRLRSYMWNHKQKILTLLRTQREIPQPLCGVPLNHVDDLRGHTIMSWYSYNCFRGAGIIMGNKIEVSKSSENYGKKIICVKESKCLRTYDANTSLGWTNGS